MILLRNAAAAAIAAGCLSSMAMAWPREPVSARIVRADLDLSHAAGRATLDRRLAAAAQFACTNGQDDLAGKMDAARCRAEMMRDGREQVAALIRNQTVQVAALAR